MDRNWLKGEDGDRINILVAACGFNMKKLLRVFLSLLSRSLFRLNFMTGWGSWKISPGSFAV
jgi:IS5 family transposase